MLTCTRQGRQSVVPRGVRVRLSVGFVTPRFHNLVPRQTQQSIHPRVPTFSSSLVCRRHMTDYRSDVLSLLVNSGQGAVSPTSGEDHSRPCQRIRSAIIFASRPSGPAQAIGRDGRCTPCPSSAMSSGWLILDRDCGRDGHRWSPPAQIRTSGITAYGSSLGCERRSEHQDKDEEYVDEESSDQR